MKVSSAIAASFLMSVAVSGAEIDQKFSNDHNIGEDSAPIKVIEYFSLTCYHCLKFHTETFGQIKKEWIDKGKVQFVFRDYPWEPLGHGAAMLAQCSGDQYFRYVDAFFERLPAIAKADDKHWEMIKQVALDQGMSEENIDNCMKNQEIFDGISKRQESGRKIYDVEATPTFIVNGKKVIGHKDVASFEKILDEALRN